MRISEKALHLTTTAEVSYTISYTDISSSTQSPLQVEGKVTTGILVEKPKSGHTYNVEDIAIVNHQASATTVSLHWTGAAGPLIATYVLPAGAILQFATGYGWFTLRPA